MNSDIHIIRESITKIVSMLTSQSIKVTQRGAKAYVAYHPTTGAILSVNVPYIPDDAKPEFISAVQGFLDHEVGHVLHTDQKYILKGAAMGPEIANLHNLIEDVVIERKMTETFRGSTSNLESVRKFFLERVSRPKIDEALAAGDKETAQGYAVMPAFRAWGGQVSSQDFIKDPIIAALIEPVAKMLGPELIARLTKVKSTKESLALAVDMHKALTPPPPPAAPPAPSKEKQEENEEQPKGKAEPGEKGEAAPEQTEPGANDEKSKPEADGPDAEAQPEGEGEGDPDAAGQADEGEPEPEAEPEADAGSGAGAGGEPERNESEREEGKGGANAGGESQDDSQDAESAQGGEEKGQSTPGPEGSGDEAGGGVPPQPTEHGTAASAEESTDLSGLFKQERDFDAAVSEALSQESVREFQDAAYKVYSTEWDKIETAPKTSSAKGVKMLEEGTEGSLGVMQKQLERAIAARAKKMWNPGQRRGRINPNGLYRVASGDDRVFRTRFETRAKNTALSLLVDCSGSMTWGNKILVAAQAAYALSTVLERLGVTHEVIGFTTKKSAPMVRAMREDSMPGMDEDSYARSEAIYMPIFKGFNERLTAEAKQRLAYAFADSHDFCRNNVDGECVQMAAHRLRMQRADRHALIVLSDGEPACSPGSYESGNMLRSHLKASVQQAKAFGVEVFGIGIMSRAVENYYDKCVVLNNVADLPTTVMGELTKLMLAD